MYALLRPLLFLLPPERAHHLTFRLLGIASRLPGMLALVGGAKPPSNAATEVMGLRFPSPVGLAAGMDKDAKHVGALARIGFGFIEVGTLTPKPQPGNPLPRLFRLKADRALINRMGFNNGGVQAAVERLRKRQPGIIVGGNIGKNKNTPNERAIDDYIACFDALHPVVDYFVVNVSSPNTPGLRALQEKGPLLEILGTLQQLGNKLSYGIQASGEYRAASGESSGSHSPLATQHLPLPKPILLKIAPDLTEGQLDDIVSVVKVSGIAGVIATNTTISRDGLRTPQAALQAIGAGGLSGAPVRSRSTDVVRYLREGLPKPFVIIGVGGIDSWEAAKEKIEAGADLVQVYTGLVYEGPALVKRINSAFAALNS
ncbi:MAG: quinone-dependent dihydroorotate dehydrogenase [Flavobacteriales bacterium]